MAYLVLARKYRPQRFSQMSGQEHVVRTLSNALRTGQLAHAFLFTGPRGVGKTTTARLVAKALNCEKGPTADPCGECTPCLEIAEGRSVDVVEIDAASNNGVDNVRDIVEGVKYLPARDRFKVFVIDEVHMLSQGAFNALLKTLEEPPEHVKFVLATTDVHRVPETIVSRCQRFDFRRLAQQEIAGKLGEVASAEGMRLSAASLALLARQAEGGMRDALSLLDQVRAAAGEAPDDTAVAEALGAVDAAAVSRLAGGLVRRDGAAVLAELEALYGRGLEMKRVAEEIVRHLRNVVVARLVPEARLDLSDAEMAEVRAQAAGADPTQLTRLFDLCQEALAEMKTAEQPRYALEVALLSGIFLAPGADVAELLARAEALAGGGAVGGPSGPGRGAPRTAAGGVPAGTGALAPERPPRAGAPAAGSTAAVPPMAPQPVPSSPPEPSAKAADPGTAWRQAVESVEQESSMAASALKQAEVLGLSPGEVSLRIAPGMYAATLEKRRAEIEVAFSRFFARPTRLALTVAPPTPPPAGEVPAPAAPSLAAAEAAERSARSRRVREAARAHPNIQEAARVLDAPIDEIEEL
ncbi:MAG TPA: DNA polymerase III subunit gamma/tau [Anaeromyxobacter sp.]|nr:DNA polymerase III subunit gamma/tau [Anaeromyxobacter sp.]